MSKVKVFVTMRILIIVAVCVGLLIFVTRGQYKGVLVPAFDTNTLKWGYADTTGKVVIPLKYEWVEHFSEDLAGVKSDGKFGFVNRKGKVVIPLKYESIERFSEGLAMVKSDGKYGFVDKDGNEVIPLKYTSATLFVEGL
ncbi:MAG: WG repeat-containing protein, partial [Prevotellaceae bacterium]|nr:WG repeat-containing protein [Prevotellaceae bacterium]